MTCPLAAANIAASCHPIPPQYLCRLTNHVAAVRRYGGAHLGRIKEQKSRHR
jgi:hypothetical protein